MIRQPLSSANHSDRIFWQIDLPVVYCIDVYYTLENVQVTIGESAAAKPGRYSTIYTMIRQPLSYRSGLDLDIARGGM